MNSLSNKVSETKLLCRNLTENLNPKFEVPFIKTIGREVRWSAQEGIAKILLRNANTLYGYQVHYKKVLTVVQLSFYTHLQYFSNFLKPKKG